METLDLHRIDGTINLTFDPSNSNITILAQTIEDVDVIAQMEDAWYNFIDSGQVWALLIGLFIGYSFKGLTSY
ncbi:MAG: hypothetical protein AAGA80_28670 [Cyanobacteria bacterium P01_F01_bin.143]